MKIVFLLPTNDKKTFNRIFMKSVHNLKRVADKIAFAINFQAPFSRYEAKKKVKKLLKMGFEVKYSYNNYETKKIGFIPFNKIRYDCALMYPNAEIYALCDDDFEFKLHIGAMIEDIIKQFDENNNLGIIQCSNNFFPFKNYLKKNRRYHTYFTDNGFFFRNIHHIDNNVLVYPSEALCVKGAGEETIIGLELASRGYDVWVRTHSEIKHHRNLINHSSPYGWDGLEVTMSEEGLTPFINNRYKDFLIREG